MSDILDKLNNIFNPNLNGVGNAFNANINGFNNFFTNTLPAFWNKTISPIVTNLYHTFIVLPMKLFTTLMEAATQFLSGNMIYIILGVVVVGGIVYYNKKIT